MDVGNLLLPARPERPAADKETWKAQYEYLQLAGAAEAIALYTQRVRAGVSADKLYENTKVELLPLVNIEAVDARWTDNLQQFLDTANSQAKKDPFGLNIVGDLLDERTLPLPASPTPPGETPKEKEELKLAAEREASDSPSVKPNNPWHKFNPKAPAGAGWVVEVRGYTYHVDGFDFVRHTLVRNLQEAGTKFALETDPTKVGAIIPDLKDPKKDPVLGKISHAFLFGQKVTKANDPARKDQPLTLTLATTSYLDRLLAAGAAAAAPSEGGEPMAGGRGGMPGMPACRVQKGAGAMPGAAGGTWVGLLRNSGSSAAGLPGGLAGRAVSKAGCQGGGAQDARHARNARHAGDARRGRWWRRGGGIAGGGVPGGPVAPPANAKNAKQLTEFIVYFIWMEPGTATESAAPQ